MNLAVLGFANARAEELQGQVPAAALRKATRNMRLSAMAVERARGDLTPETLAAMAPGDARTAVLLHSKSGEMDASAEFLANWDQSKLARPLLFQNSLHNATAGFLSIHFGWVGPSVTFSSRSEDGLEIADLLLQSGTCDRCWLVACEVHGAIADLAELRLQAGAAAVLLATQETAEREGWPVRARLRKFARRLQPRTETVLGQAPLLSFEKDFLDNWVEALRLGKKALPFRSPVGDEVELAWD